MKTQIRNVSTGVEAYESYTSNYYTERMIHIVDLALAAIHDFARIIIHYLTCFIPSRSDSTPKSYFFSQQVNDSCHISPIENLKLLGEFVEKGCDSSKMSHFNKRQWLGRNQPFNQAWNQCISALEGAGGRARFPNIHAFLETADRKGPNLPNIRNEHGHPFVSRIPWRTFNHFYSMPYFFIDTGDLDHSFWMLFGQVNLQRMLDLNKMGLKIPIVEKKGALLIFDPSSRNYIPIANTPLHGTVKRDGKLLFPSTLTEADRKQYNIPKGAQSVRFNSEKILGFDGMAISENLGQGLEINDRRVIVYELSLYKMMMLVLGYDSNHTPITESHPDFELHREFKTLFSAHDNPWHPSKFKKETLFQVHLAQMIKENPDLKAVIEGVVDTLDFASWKTYSHLLDGKYSRRDRSTFDSQAIKEMFPGKEQALAYFFMKGVRTLFYTGCSSEILKSALSEIIRKADGIFPLKTASTLLKGRARLHHKIPLPPTAREKNRTANISYLETLQWVNALMKDKIAKGLAPPSMMSFDDHGWVISYDPKILHEQKTQSKLEDAAFIEKLGFAGIESLYSGESGLWYVS